MRKNNIETVKNRGIVYETLDSAARRYGVPAKVILEHMGRELFRATDPRTGIKMVCGALPEEVLKWYKDGEKVRITFGTVMEYLFACPSDRFLTNMAWLVAWVGIGWLVGSQSDAGWGVMVTLMAVVVRLIFAVKHEMEHPQEYNEDAGAGLSLAEVDAMYYGGGGDGFFDEVSTRRRSDLQFLLGTGPFAQ